MLLEIAVREGGMDWQTKKLIDHLERESRETRLRKVVGIFRLMALTVTGTFGAAFLGVFVVEKITGGVALQFLVDSLGSLDSLIIFRNGLALGALLALALAVLMMRCTE